MHIFPFTPWKPVFLLRLGPWPKNKAGATGFGRIPAMCVADSKGQVGENGEEIEPHLLVYGIGVEMA
jgi:hypothetical protein